MSDYDLFYNHGFVGVIKYNEKKTGFTFVVDTDWPEPKAKILLEAIEQDPEIEPEALFALVGA